MVLEFKAENLELKVEDCYQDYNYATWSRADLFAVSNGKETQVYKVVDTELPLSLKPIGEIPNANIINNAKKLKEELEKTVEFKGDEFAKVLNKCHNIIRNNDKLSPEAAFDEISKVLFIKIMYERNINQNQMFSLDEFKRLRENFREIHKGTSQENDSFIQYRFEQVKREFEKDHIFEPNETIRIRESSFEDIVKELEKYNLTKTGADVKGIAFETFLGRTFRGELGQFFTPRKVVEFMVDVLDIKQNELICDPCAGSGGFLIRAFEIVKDKIDEKYIRLKKLKQREVFGENLENIDDEKLKAKYEQVINELNEKQKLEIQYLSKSSIFGTDANPRMARVSKMNMIMHGDGHNGIHHNDGLLNVNGIFRNRFDVILTNPPFGTNLGKDNSKVSEEDKYTDEKMITHYKKIYGDVYEEELKQVTDNFGKPIRSLYKTGEISGATEVLFVERCLDLLKAGGRMGIVLPEGVLNSSNLQKAREYFESRAKILLIVSLPQDLFVSSGATVKTSLVFLKKFTVEEQKQDKKGLLRFVRFEQLQRWDTDFFKQKEGYSSKYETVSYEDLFVSLNNGIAARNYASDGIRYLKVSDIKDNYINNKPFYVNKYKESDLIEKGTLLITRKGTVGNSYYLDKDGSFVASSEIFIIKLNDKVNGNYLSEINLSSFVKKQYREKSTGTIMPSLSQPKLKSILIPLPPLEIQNHIAVRIQKLKDYIKALEQQAEQNRENALRNFEAEIFSKE